MRSDAHLDPAALAGAALSAVLATMLVTGPFDWINLILGITILVLLIAFVEGHTRSRLQSMALGAICAFCSLLVLGPVVEVILQAVQVEPDSGDSRVPQEALFVTWLVAASVELSGPQVLSQGELTLPRWTLARLTPATHGRRRISASSGTRSMMPRADCSSLMNTAMEGWTPPSNMRRSLMPGHSFSSSSSTRRMLPPPGRSRSTFSRSPLKTRNAVGMWTVTMMSRVQSAERRDRLWT